MFAESNDKLKYFGSVKIGNCYSFIFILILKYGCIDFLSCLGLNNITDEFLAFNCRL